MDGFSYNILMFTVLLCVSRSGDKTFPPIPTLVNNILCHIDTITETVNYRLTSLLTRMFAHVLGAQKQSYIGLDHLLKRSLAN